MDSFQQLLLTQKGSSEGEKKTLTIWKKKENFNCLKVKKENQSAKKRIKKDNKILFYQLIKLHERRKKSFLINQLET